MVIDMLIEYNINKSIWQGLIVHRELNKIEEMKLIQCVFKFVVRGSIGAREDWKLPVPLSGNEDYKLETLFNIIRGPVGGEWI